MKPIAIVQHEAEVAAGNFADHMQRRARPVELIRVYAGDKIPAAAERYAGICSLGGNMSVNDALPWIDDELALLRDANLRGVPVIGHCLGGQLLARALGAEVARAAHVEMGWGRVRVEHDALAREWLGEAADAIEYFQWHGDAFDLPAGAQRILGGDWCANQAFVVERGRYAHIGMQFHIEMTPKLVRLWTDDPPARREIERAREQSGGTGVQSIGEMNSHVEQRAAKMYRVAAHLYDRWLRGARD